MPGQPTPWPASQIDDPTGEATNELALHREAEAVLRRMHDAQPQLPWPELARDKIREFDLTGQSAARLFAPYESDRARALAAALAYLPTPMRVPCHHDYSPATG